MPWPRASSRLDLLFNNAGMGAPAVPIDELPLEKWQQVVDTSLNGSFYCLQQAFRLMKSQRPQGRAHHQQRLDLGAHAAPALGRLYVHQACGDRPDASRSRSTGARTTSPAAQIDIGNAATPMTDRMVGGVLQPDGAMKPEPRMDAEHVGSAVALHGVACRSTPTCCS